MDYLEFKAKTVDEAITQACLKYGVTSERLDYTIVEEGKARFFGLFGSRDAVIKAKVKEEKKEQAAVDQKKDVQPSKNFDKKGGKKSVNANRTGERKPETSGKSSGKADGKSAGKNNSGKNFSQNSENEANKGVKEDTGKLQANVDSAVNKEAEAGEKAVDGYKKSGKGDKSGKYDKKGGRSGKSERKIDRQGTRVDKAGKPNRNRNDDNADGFETTEERSSEGAADSFANESSAEAANRQNLEVRTGRYGGDIVTADEIEKRAAAAAAKAMEEGITYPEDMPGEDRPPRRDRRDRRDRRGRRNDRQGGRGRKYGEENVESEGSEKPHRQSQPKPARVVIPKTDEEVTEMKEAAGSFLENVFRCMNVNVEITMNYDPVEGCLNCIFAGDEMGILIGKRGQTLDSLQYLTSLVVNKNKNDYTRVKLDTEDYRARREDTLENLSRNIAYKVRRTGRSVALEPMNPYERRIIHSSLQGNRFVETYSEGEEPYRHVVVAPKRK